LIKHRSNPTGAHRHPQGDGAFQRIQHGAERPDRHLTGSVLFGSDAICRGGLAIK